MYVESAHSVFLSTWEQVMTSGYISSSDAECTSYNAWRASLTGSEFSITIGPAVVKALRPHTDKPFDVHLMISPIDSYIDAFAEAGADFITVHPEAGPHIHRTLQAIRAAGAKPGVVLNPGTPAKMLDYLIDEVDLVLVMSVNPGFGGQSFIHSQLKKVEAIRKMIDRTGRAIHLEVDGGVNAETARLCVDAGADVLVAGSATFKGGPDCYAANIAALKGQS